MKYVSKALPANYNISAKPPLKEFAQTLAGALALLIGLYIVLGWFVGILA
jgi:hypothetical protein